MGEFVNLGSFIIQLINMAVIIYVLNRFLFKPYMAYIVEEDKKRKEMEYAYNNLDLLKEDAKREATMIIEDAKKTANEERSKITEAAQAEKNRIIDDATQEGKSIIAYANNEIEKSRLTMLQSIKSNVLDLSLNLITKIFGKNEVNRDFLERELNSIK